MSAVERYKDTGLWILKIAVEFLIYLYKICKLSLKINVK